MNPVAAPPTSWRGLRALAVAHGLSALADGVYLVALPWLALDLTGSSAALGSVLAVAALPRAAFLVVGGAWADRGSPRLVLALSSGLSAGVTGALAILATAGELPAWGLYVAAAVLGVADAVAFPAASALVPRLVAASRLHRANALLGVLTQGATFVGPAVAALLLAGGGAASALAASMALSAGAVVAVAFLPRSATPEAPAPSAGVLSDLREGVAYVRARSPLAWTVVLLAGLNLALVGPVLVGGALLAETRFGDAEVFGALVAAWGAGGLAGSVGAGAWSPKRPLRALLGACLGMSVGLAALALPVPLAGVLAVAAGLGAANGWLEVTSVSYIQRQAAPEVQGRVMGLVALAVVGTEPISHALAGTVAALGVGLLFMAGAGLVLAMTLVVGLRVGLRSPTR